MRYGIQEDETGVKCANCSRLISEDGEMIFEYCPTCGAPLTELAISEAQKRDAQIEKDLLFALRDISKSNNTDSLRTCIEHYLKD